MHGIPRLEALNLLTRSEAMSLVMINHNSALKKRLSSDVIVT